MFHCNGWCFPWAVTAVGGTHVCLRKVDPALVWELIEREGVTHFCGAPTVLIALANHPAAQHSCARPLTVIDRRRRAAVADDHRPDATRSAPRSSTSTA